MFEVGFSELLMVGLVALLAIGPEKLPKAARVAGFWIGKVRGMLAGAQAEIRQELMMEEMRQLARQNLDERILKQMITDGEIVVRNDESAVREELEAAMQAATHADASDDHLA